MTKRDDSKHTPGPRETWTAYRAETGNWVVRDDDENIVANCGPNGEERARLIAAAPATLAALGRLVAAFEYGRDPMAMEEARAAIARARGVQGRES